MNRREFLGTMAMAALAGGCASDGENKNYAGKAHRAGEKLKIAVIGAGGQGEVDCRMIDHIGDRIVALCDVDENTLASAQKSLERTQGKIRGYKDFRVMFDAERSLDAVFICTPDHGHAMQTLWALEKSCPVYIEPPLARTLAEVRAVHTKALAMHIPVWMGTQNRSSKEFRRAVSCLETGLLGPVHSIHAWTNRPLWPQGIRQPDGTDIVPAELDWDLWLGPAPARPYKEKVYHSFNWRGWRDFGTGAFGDAGCHLLSLPFSVVPLGSPVAVQCLQGGDVGDTYPKASRLHFIFQEKRQGWFGKKPQPVTLDWYDGGLLPDARAIPQVQAAFGDNLPASGCVMVGERGVWMTAGLEGREHWLALKDEKSVRDFENHDACAAIPAPRRNIAMQKTFLDMIRLGKQSVAPFGYSLPLMETVLCGCVSQQLKGPVTLTWNTGKTCFEKDYANLANALVSQPVREGW